MGILLLPFSEEMEGRKAWNDMSEVTPDVAIGSLVLELFSFCTDYNWFIKQYLV